MNAKVIALLKEARKMIESPSTWTQKAFCRGTDGYDLDPLNEYAVCWCTLGALFVAGQKYGPNHRRKAENLLNMAAAKAESDTPLNCGIVCGIVNYNDTHTHSEIMGLLDSVIADLESQP